MRRIASLAGAIVATALLAAQPAAADGLNGAGKSPLFESGFSGWTCATGAVTTAVATEGFVVLNTEASGDLSAEVGAKCPPTTDRKPGTGLIADADTPFARARVALTPASAMRASQTHARDSRDPTPGYNFT